MKRDGVKFFPIMPISPKHKGRKTSADSDVLHSSDPANASHRSHLSSSPSADDEAGITSGSVSVAGETHGASPENGSAKKRHHSRSNGRRLNTWDVPEFLPGAQPGATAVQREYFQDRSIKVFRKEQMLQKQDELESEKRKSERYAEKLEHDMTHLRELFPSIETEVIQETYLLAEGDMDSIINQLLVLSGGGATDERPGPPSSDDEREFPVLTDQEGWEVVNPAEIQMTIEEGSLSQQPPVSASLYKDKLMNEDVNKD